ncbi:MAG: NTP transferase domain-containing protein [Halobacterium sp.]
MTLPVVDPPAERAGEASVAGVLLAAGTSSRYGDANKLLADVDGTPMVRRSAATLLDAGLSPVVVVVGYEADRVRDALEGLDVAFAENPDYESGQASSVRAGVRAVERASADVDAAVFALGDMPFVSPESVRALVAAYEAGEGSALAAGFDGERGNPVLFDAAHFPALAGREGDVGGKHVLLSADDAAVVETDDAGVRRDVDRPSDQP